MDNILKEIKKSIQDECIAQGEIAYLESHKQEVLNTGDIELCQWAGITEEEFNNGKLNPDLKYEEDFISVELDSDNEGDVFCTLTIDDGQKLVLTEHELKGLARILKDNYSEIEEYYHQNYLKFRNE